jgi:hypothetical protein
MLVVALLLAVIGIVLYQYRGLFSFVRYRQALKALEAKVETPGKPLIETVCPRCGESMEAGYLVGPDGIYWNEDVPFYGLGLQFRGARLMNEPFAPYNASFTGRASVLSSTRCRRCKLIQIQRGPQDLRTL